ncbi:UDP-N-acetylmuramoyl-L-alanine--D-glutamate ligase [Pediococcus argentinicus]|uniref:UDP-N-acetylmuramoylalanine--D-glutamate ligase n=1 Tax=Pediococcus argentinicus TaxID=480391 RepID=A0A0R2NL79_9LACO|nr:UDP-N-acetylmuramoyl-L-alanine--D-glutamate ligase [Pediococcus argentinicus]KRO24797.1 UDP-N-acetylmuramoylalanine-D-glutamate ligase [Pediococcus argentinicus]NKZ22713.1 UDP-N-acetylmuramoyl-L-alanine--D-glutamate ligase [Pediococcus argentinicus]GEP19710.1 UDP-N-acetylmuramoylalanine--D-glutamate ligase [Pediococcus argentinicus]
MKINKSFENKNVLVLGLAKSGTSAALLLHKLGANVVVNDANAKQDENLLKQLKQEDITTILGSHPDDILSKHKIELIVKNPGIPYTNPVLVTALANKIEIISEPELAYQISDSNLIGVTGSNGKTTVTTLINLMINEGGKKAYVAGNIGVPATTVAQEAEATDTIVMELSSFMLAGIRDLHPHIAVVNNIFSNHLDWHKTRANYIHDKMRITENQTNDDYLIMNWDREEWQKIAKKSNAQVVPFSRQGLSEDGAYEKDSQLFFKNEYIMDAKDIAIPGEQNVENALAAIAAAKLSGTNNASIVQVLKTFSGVKHRIQFVDKIDGRVFYNDSKATDIEATEVALSAFDQPIILLAGGLDRGDDYSRLVPMLKKNVKAVVLNGETADNFKEAAEKAGIETIIKVDKVKNGVSTAFELSEPGDVVLLSPAAASWDQYPNFEIRGDEFIEAVKNINK